MTPLAHPREARLRKRRDFQRVQSIGTRTPSRYMTVIVAESEGSRARLGTAVSRRVGNAVVRNRVRRLLKEIFRHHAAAWPPVDVFVIARPELAALAAEGREAMERETLPALERAVRRRVRGP